LSSAHLPVEGTKTAPNTLEWHISPSDPGCGKAFLKDLNDNPKFAAWFNQLSDQAKYNALRAWKIIKNKVYPNVGHRPWEITRQEIIARDKPSEIKILNAVENAAPPTNSQVAVAGAYSHELGGSVIIRYNNRSFDVNQLEPELKQYVDYLQMIKNDFDTGGNMYKNLYSNVPELKIQNAGAAGFHAEVLATNEVVRRLKAAGKFNGMKDLNKIEVLVKGKSASFGNMCRCPHCFYITDGVKMIGNQ